jgi:hypothetical protein
MRFITLTVLALAAAGASFAGAARSETTTYIEGNLTGVTPQTGGTLVFSDDKTMTFRTGLASVPVAYGNITKAELGQRQVHSHDVPVYKVWALHKKFAGKTETQLLTIAFKNDEGEDRTMTLELARNSAATVVNTINSHRSAPVTESAAATEPAAKATKAKAKKEEPKVETAKTPKPADRWWGDDYWKTTRNSSSWGTATASNDAKPAAEKPAAEKPAQQQK